MRSSRRTGAPWTYLMALVLLMTGCSTDSAAVMTSDPGTALSVVTHPTTTPPPPSTPGILSTPVQLLLDSAPEAIGADTIEVWVCQVPLDTTDPTFNISSLRLDLDPVILSNFLNLGAAQHYFDLSHGAYRPVFVSGGIHQMTSTESPEQCVGAALDSADPESNAVFAIGTAESGASTSGGFGTSGHGCETRPIGACSAAETSRGAYVGASDFHPDWGPEPLMDLVEHEMGHMLGWPHSGSDTDGAYSSGLDLMSNSAAPRGFDPTRRDAQDTLGINRFASGWLSLADVVIISADSIFPPDLSLEPSTAQTGTRLLILPVDDLRFLTVEYLPQTGLDSFFPEGGITITLIDQTPGACANPTPSPCTAENRGQFTQVGKAPFYDLLGPDDPAWNGFGWTVTATALGEVATIQIAT